LQHVHHSWHLVWPATAVCHTWWLSHLADLQRLLVHSHKHSTSAALHVERVQQGWVMKYD
jgi:hypothetical protein